MKSRKTTGKGTIAIHTADGMSFLRRWDMEKKIFTLVARCLLFVLFVGMVFPAQLMAQTDTAEIRNDIRTNLLPVDTTPPAVYKINPLKTVLIGAAATAANMIAINNILHNKADLTLAEVEAANRNTIGRIDRWALDLDPSKRDHFYRLSDHTLTAILAGSAATFVLGKRTRKDWLCLGLMYYQTQFLTFAFYDFSPFGPAFQNKLRPVVYYDYFPMELRRRGNQKNSFYSGHVANATAATFFAAKVYSDYHPEIGNKKYLLYSLASLPALFNGWLRIKALAHFPSDALAGFLIGGTFGIVVPELHRIKNPRIQVNTFYNGMGAGLQFTYKLGVKTNAPQTAKQVLLHPTENHL
jgi:hypothetical protein